MHRVGVRAQIRESAGLIELVGDPSPEALHRLAELADQRFRGTPIQTFGRRAIQREIETLVRARGLRIAQTEHER